MHWGRATGSDVILLRTFRSDTVHLVIPGEGAKPAPWQMRQVSYEVYACHSWSKAGHSFELNTAAIEVLSDQHRDYCGSVFCIAMDMMVIFLLEYVNGHILVTCVVFGRKGGGE